MLPIAAIRLDSACKAFGVEQGKGAVIATASSRRHISTTTGSDVAATAALAYKLLEEYDRFDVELPGDAGLFPGIAREKRTCERWALRRSWNGAVRKRYLGYAESAFFGGRTSAHIRKVPVPVVYTDFLSMYPTVNALMGLWRYVVAEEVSVVSVDVSEMRIFSARLRRKNSSNRRRGRNFRRSRA